MHLVVVVVVGCRRRRPLRRTCAAAAAHVRHERLQLVARRADGGQARLAPVTADRTFTFSELVPGAWTFELRPVGVERFEPVARDLDPLDDRIHLHFELLNNATFTGDWQTPFTDACKHYVNPMDFLEP